MSDMELVIKISKEDYEVMKHNVAANNPLCPLREAEMVSIVANGTPLPKGRGNIIAVQDAVDNLMEYKEIGIFGNHDKRTILECINRIEDHVEPIIEADKEREI